MIVPLDPVEGEQYTKPVREGDDVDHIYKLTMWDIDWINPTASGMLNWEKDSSCLSDSDGEMENWQNRLHDVFALCYLKITKNFWCISSEVDKYPILMVLVVFKNLWKHWKRPSQRNKGSGCLIWLCAQP